MATTEFETYNEIKNLTISRKKKIPISISANIYEKLTRHLFLLKAIHKRFSQSDWIFEAIRESLENENKNEGLNKEKKLAVYLDDQTFEKLEKQVEFFKQIYPSFSKKKWIVEAICKKLDKDSSKLNEEVQKMRLQKKG